MYGLLDDYAHSNGLRETSPRIKLLIGISSILVCVFSRSPLAPVVVALAMSLAIWRLGGIPLAFYLKLMAIPLSFALVSALIVAFTYGSGAVLWSTSISSITISVSDQGANLFLLLLSRTLGGTASLFFIALTTPVIEIFSVLKSLGLPEVFVELSMLIYRYIFILMDQAMMIHSAQVMRLGYCGLKTSLGSFSMLSSVLFIRAWEQGERLMTAMDSRGYCGRLETMDEDVPVRPGAVLAVLIYVAGIAAIAYITRDISLI
jgi:cobalt/nickel transport system permease protein